MYSSAHLAFDGSGYSDILVSRYGRSLSLSFYKTHEAVVLHWEPVDLPP